MIKLTRSEEKFNKLFEYAPFGMAMIKHETGEFVEVNQTLLDWTGYTKEEFLNLSFWEITPPEYQDQEQQQMSDLESKGRFGPNEKEYIRKDGSRFQIRLKGFLLEDADGTKLVWGVIEDISNEYQRIFEALQDAYMQFDFFYNLIMVNQGTVKMFGYTTKDEMLGKNLSDLFVDHLMLEKIKHDLKMNCSISNCICECVRKDGTTFWISFNAQHIKDKEDKTVSLEGVMRDITERISLEEDLVVKSKELEVSEERLRLIVESISDTIGITDANGVVKYRSSNNERLFGIDSESVVGQNSFDFVHPDDRERLFTEFSELVKDGSGAKRTGEFQYLRRDGSTVMVELEARNMLDNKLIGGLLLTFRDITEKKAADRKMKEESEKLKALIESTDNMVWVVDPVEFGLMTFNNALSQYFRTGRNLEIQEGMKPEDLLPNEYAAQWRRMYTKVLAQGAYKFEYGTSSNNRILELSFYPVKIDNELIGISVMGQDITERKQTERKILAANENLNKIMNNSMFGVVTIGEDKKIRWANPAAVKMMGLEDSDDVVGKKCTEYFCPAHEDMCPIFDEGQKVDNSEKKIKCYDGKHIPIIKSVAEIEIDGENLLLETFIDITERKLMESSLRESEERFRGIISSMDDVVYTLDTEQRHTGVFGSWLEKSNLTEAFFIGKTSSEIFGSEIGKVHHAPTRQALSGENVVYEWSLNNGNERTYYQTSLSPMCDDTGKVSGLVGIGRDITKINVYKDEIEKNNQRLNNMLDQSINAISKISELRDVYTAGHPKKVQQLAVAIAREIGLPEEMIHNISQGALIHDIGKIYIPSDLLSKQGKLTELEYRIIKTHSTHGFEIVKDIDFAWQIPAMIHQHHERLDGSGYPNNLKGDEILMESRILAIADVVEAMSSHRPYRPNLGIDAALEEISKYSGIKFDPIAVDACIRLFREKNFSFS